MTKTLIFIPRSTFLQSDRVMPTLGPLYLKSFLDSRGYETTLDDLPNIDNLRDLTDFDIIGISTTTPQYYCVGGGRDLAKKVRELYPEKKLIIGGAHAKNYFQETIRDNLFDSIIRGDGELEFLNLLENLKKRDFQKVINAVQLSAEQMNSFPLPWRNREYLMSYEYWINGTRATTAMTSRYCTMKCKFCEERDAKLKMYNLDRVKLELQQIKSMGFGSLMFYDDILPITKSRTEEICKITKELNLKFRCNGHVGIMTRSPEILETMAESGCLEICLGIESGDQKILDIIDKKIKVPEIFKATENILKQGIRVSAYLMIGLPSESKETIANTEKYLARFSKEPNFGFDLTIYYPYRYSYIRENMGEFDLNLHLEGSIGLYKGKDGLSECCVSTSSLTREDIIKERERLLDTYRNVFRGTKSIHT